MKFKITFYLLCCSLLLTACDGSAHKHSAESWERNVSTHWQECECGETFNLGEHTIENDECSACKSEIYTYDGGADIYNYNINNTYIILLLKHGLTIINQLYIVYINYYN